MGFLQGGVDGGGNRVIYPEETALGATDLHRLPRPGYLRWGVDFKSIGVGAKTSLGTRLMHACPAATAMRTVQTGTSAVDTNANNGYGADVALVGRPRDADSPGIAMWPQRTNRVFTNRDITSASWNAGGGGVVTTGNAAAGPDGQVLADRSQVPAGTNGRYYIDWATPVGRHTLSQWQIRGSVGATNQAYFVVNSGAVLNDRYFWWGAAPVAWARIMGTPVNAHAANNAVMFPCDGTNRAATGGDPAGAVARDAITDLYQDEVGLYGTDVILVPGVAGVTRPGNLLWLPDGSDVLVQQRAALEFCVRAGCAAAGMDANQYLWERDATNYIRILGATRRMEVCLNGSIWSPAEVFAWAQYDLIRFHVEFGGGMPVGLQSFGWYQVNQLAVVDLGSSGGPQAAIPLGPQYLCSSAVAPTNGQFAGWTEEILAWEPLL